MIRPFLVMLEEGRALAHVTWKDTPSTLTARVTPAVVYLPETTAPGTTVSVEDMSKPFCVRVVGARAVEVDPALTPDACDIHVPGLGEVDLCTNKPL